MQKSLMLILLVSLLMLSACTRTETKSLEGLYRDAKLQNVNKVIIQDDGSTAATKTIIKHQQVDEFLALIKDIEFIPHENQGKREGWRYGISLFDRDKEYNFTLNEINNTYYNTKPDIQPIVDIYYKQLDVPEE